MIVWGGGVLCIAFFPRDKFVELKWVGGGGVQRPFRVGGGGQENDLVKKLIDFNIQFLPLFIP